MAKRKLGLQGQQYATQILFSHEFNVLGFILLSACISLIPKIHIEFLKYTLVRVFMWSVWNEKHEQLNTSSSLYPIFTQCV
jgi:uncharacterized membrane protein